MAKWLAADWLHWLYLLGGIVALGFGLAFVRCLLDFIGWWPMDYTDMR